MVTAAELNVVLGTTDAQITKLYEWMDAVYPKIDSNGDPVANTLDDLAALIAADVQAKYLHWKATQTEVTF
jgi:hypothetical protein